MKRFTLTLVMLGLLAFSGRLFADEVSYQGIFSSDDDVQLFNFNVSTAGLVTLQTFGYAGGVNGTGTVIPAGGFDPVLTLFDGSGNFLVTNDDGPCGTVGTDPTTLNCFDAYLSLDLGAGAYTAALTEYDNLPNGPTLADSFSQVGNGDFTCPEFLGTPGAFCDASPSQRDSAWALDITTPGTSPVPEPASDVLVLSGISLLFALRKQLVDWRRL
jgi:PEP-CTERM motif